MSSRQRIGRNDANEDERKYRGKGLHILMLPLSGSGRLVWDRRRWSLPDGSLVNRG